MKIIFTLIFIVFFNILSFGQLNPGDIAIVESNADGNDNFAFVALIDIPASEVIKFTDNGWKSSGSWRNNEGVITWTAPSGGTSCGTVVHIDDGSTSSLSASEGSVSKSGGFNLSGSGDQLIAYQNTSDMIAAFQTNGKNWDSDATSSNTSAIPDGLTDGTNCVHMTLVSDADDCKYSINSITDTKANILSSINNPSNWTISSSTIQDYKGSITNTDCGSCTAPTTQASSITFSSVDYTSMTVNWTSGNGSNRVVIMNTSNSFTAPADGTDPTADNSWNNSGQQVVYNGNSNSVDITNLDQGTTYWYRVYEYNCTGSNTVYNTNSDTDNPNSQATLACTAPTSESSSMTFTSVESTSMTVNWTSGDGENRIVVVHQGSAVTSDPANGTTYSASSTYGDGDDIGTDEFVVYNGSGNSVTVDGLSASTTYFFKVFEYNCSGGNEIYLTTSPLEGNQTTTATPIPAVLTQGDIVVVGVCSNIKDCVGGSAGDDEISFVCFKDITEETEIDMTDNGWERCHSGQWGNAEGYIRIKRTGGTIVAGTVITFRTHGSGTAFEGVFPDNDWSITATGGFARLILNSNGDQIYFMQDGTWDDGTSGDNDATYTGGEILFGFNTNDTWTSGICSASNSSSGNGRSQNSGLYSGMDCFNMVPNAATDYLKYTGPTTPTSQIGWVGRINDNTNWSDYSNCTNYYAGSPDYTNGDTLQITATGLTTTYQWYGNKDTEWFECANWGPLRVPADSNDVIIPNSTQVDNDIVLNAGENAECNNFTVEDTIHTIKGENGATKVLTVNGDLTINGGTIDFDDDNNSTIDGTIYVKGNWTNNNATTDFMRGNSTVIFNGNTTQTVTSNSGIENFANIQITGSSVLDLNGNDLQVSGNWTNYNQSGLTEGTSTITFDGTTNQNINTTGGEVIYNAVIDNPTTVTLSNNLTVSNQLNLSQGELVINGKTLTLQNDLIRTTGTFTGSNSSDMIINGTGNLATSLYFTSGSESLNNLTVNRLSSGTATMGTNLTIYGQMGMTAGKLDINDKVLTLNGTISGTGTLKGSANSEIYIGGSGNLGTMYFSTGAQEVKNLTTNRTSGISTLGTDLTVNTLLTLTNGLITTGANNLIISTSNVSAVTGQNTNSYVNGNLRRAFASNTDTYAFPVGTSTMYTLAEIVNNNLVGINYIDSKFLSSFSNSGALDPAKAVDFGTPYVDIAPEGIWYLEPDAQPTGGDYTIKLHFDDGGGANPFTELDDNKFGPLKRPVSSTSASDWTALNGTLNANGGTGRMVADGFAQRNNITSFSHFAIGRSDFALPIELIDFNASIQNNAVKLEWTTAAEINNDFFTIERSADALSFDAIQTIPGAGNSTKLNQYETFDFSPLDGESYYRLRQTDFDGKSTVSKIVAVDFFNSNNINFYRNIFISQNSIIIEPLNIDEVYSVKLFDINGKIIFSSENINNTLNINTSQFAKGVYLLKINTKSNIYSRKVLK